MTNLLFTLRVHLSEGTATIRAFDHPGNPMCGSQRIDVEVRHMGRTIFPRGFLYCGTPQCGGMAVDGARAKEMVLYLVALKPGDTDDEYFSDYSPEQLAWANRFGEEIDSARDCRFCDPETGSMRECFLDS